VNKKILIIDDSVFHRRMLRQFLKRTHSRMKVEDYDPIGQDRPRSDFDWGRYDLVIMDYQLNNGTGLDWLQLYSSHPAFPPVIILTGEGDEDLAVRSIKMGASNYLSKTGLSPLTLAEAVNEAVPEIAKLYLEGVVEKGSEETARAPHIDTDSGETRVIAGDAHKHLQESEGEISEPQTKTQPVSKGSSTGGKKGTGRPDMDWPFTTADMLAGKAHIKKYRIVGYIGKGGMATVFKAQRGDEDELFALKLLHHPIVDDPSVLYRFFQEFQIAERIQHSHLVHIFAQGFDESIAFTVMEYLSGGDLRYRMRRGVDKVQAVRYITQISSALQALHENKIIHRDLKPGNVMFRDDDTLVVADFGIAKQLDAHLSLTKAGEMVGTPKYTSPEQAMGEPESARSDLYALGIMFYEMLTGKYPYVCDNAIDLMKKHVSEPLPPLKEELAEFMPVIELLSAKQPEHRYQSAGELEDDLRRRYPAYLKGTM